MNRVKKFCNQPCPEVNCSELIGKNKSKVVNCGKYSKQRWSPRGRPWPRGRSRGHILKSLALASKPHVLENCPVLGSRTALYLERLKFC